MILFIMTRTAHSHVVKMARINAIAILFLLLARGGVDAFLSSKNVVGKRIMMPLSSRHRIINNNDIGLHAFNVVDLSEVNAVAQSAEAVLPYSATVATTAVTTTAAGITNSMSTAINSFFQTQPYLAAFLTCSFKASAADILAQTQEDSSQKIQQQPNQVMMDADVVVSTSLVQSSPPPSSSSAMIITPPDVDVSRNMGFLLYGGLYQGMAQNFLYSVVYPNLVGDGTGWDIVATKVLMDNLIFAPFLCLPIAYIFKAAFTTTTTTSAVEDDERLLNIKMILSQSIQKYFYDVTTNGLLMKYWSIWVPVQFLTFGIIPEHFRVAFVAFISFFWIFILSTVVSTSSSSLSHDKET